MSRTVTARISRELSEYLKDCQRQQKMIRRTSRISIPEISKTVAMNLRFTLPPESFYMVKKRRK